MSDIRSSRVRRTNPPRSAAMRRVAVVILGLLLLVPVGGALLQVAAATYDRMTVRSPGNIINICRVALKSALPQSVWRNYPETGGFRRDSDEFEEALVAREGCFGSKR